MTDTFGSEPHDHDEGSPPENDAPHESQDTVTEAPSEYEFSDAPSPDGPQGEKPARRSPLLPIAAALGGIVLLGSVAWWQLSGSSSSTASLPVAKSAVRMLPLPALPATPSSENNRIASATASLGLPAPISPKTDSIAPKEGESAGSSLGASSSARPSLPENSAAQANPTENIVPRAPLAPAGSEVFSGASSSVSAAPIQSSNDSNHRIDILTARVDSLQKALDQANQQLGQMTGALAASSGTGTQDRIDKLEQQIEALSRPATSSVALPSAPEGVSASAKPVSVAKHKTTQKFAHKVKAPAAAKRKSAKGWVLRAASPNQAWISENATSRDLREIHVGDKVPGIGKVSVIEAQGDKWVVHGTKGSIQ